ERPAVIRAENVGEVIRGRARPDGSLQEAGAGRLEEDATVREAVKGRSRKRAIHGAGAVPVDRPPPAWQRAGGVAIVGIAESRLEGSDRTLDVRGTGAYVYEKLHRASRVGHGQEEGCEHEGAA